MSVSQDINLASISQSVSSLSNDVIKLTLILYNEQNILYYECVLEITIVTKGRKFL